MKCVQWFSDQMAVVGAMVMAVSVAGSLHAAVINVSGGEPNLTSAITTANGDAAQDEIIITDSATYTVSAAFPVITNPLIIRAAAGQTPVIQNTGASGQVFRPTAEFYLIGAGPSTRMTVRQGAPHAGGQPVINSGTGLGTSGYHYENLVVERGGTGTGVFININNQATSHTLKNVSFVGGTGASWALVMAPTMAPLGSGNATFTLDNLDFSALTAIGSHMYTNSNVGLVNASNCKFTAGVGRNLALMYHPIGESIAGTFNLADCTFMADPVATPIFYQNYADLTQPCPDTMNLIRPVFSGPIGAVGFLISKGGTLSISGASAASKASLNSVFSAGTFTSPTLLLARVRGGNAILTDVAATAAPAPEVVGLCDSVVLDSFNPLAGNVAVTFDRCDFQSGVLGYHADTVAGGGFVVSVTAANSVFNGAGAVRNSVISLNGDSLGVSAVTLNNCTLYGAPTSLVEVGLDFAEAASVRSDALTGNYSVFDGSSGLRCGSSALAGTRNVVKAGSASAFLSAPGDTRIVTGSMGLSATGRLSGSGPAVDYAVGSPQIVDVDGNSRPLGAEKDSGASEVAFADVCDWALY
jgi:hypothetical protein